MRDRRQGSLGFEIQRESRWTPGDGGSGSAYLRGGTGAPGARFIHATADRKLAPVGTEPHRGRPRPIPLGPYCSATYVSIRATCPDSCRFRDGACYVSSGFTAPLGKKLDAAAARLEPDAVIENEATLLERAFGGARVPQDGARGPRDLRLHIGGDVPSEAAARRLAWAVDTWRYRGGGSVWTFTHRWREIPSGVTTWGRISVLASVETPEDAEAARRRGYVPAIVLRRFPTRRAFRLPGLELDVIPCPAETTGGRVTCVECRLCLDAPKLRARGKAIGFALHGTGKHRVRLPTIA